MGGGLALTLAEPGRLVGGAALGPGGLPARAAPGARASWHRGGARTEWPSPLGRASGPEPRALRFRLQSHPTNKSRTGRRASSNPGALGTWGLAPPCPCRSRERTPHGPWAPRVGWSGQGSQEHLIELGVAQHRLTTQWSVEDEEEAARERRRRERDRQLRAQDEDGGSQSPELPEQETLSHQHTFRNRDGDEQSPASVCLEALHLSPSSELQEGPGTEEIEPKSPEGTMQGSLGPAEAEEADEQHQERQQPRTPSPLVLEGATEQGSPPLSPSTKLIDRTESLNRSIKKSNSVKKSQPALPISKIDERLEQYTQAVETAGRTSKLTRQPSIELPSMAVASTKSRWETGEVQAQSTAKTPSCKDIVAGDMSKKSLWEQKGDSKTSSTIKSTPSGKRYKFVATGHGKYEKVLVDEGSVP
ncbi:lymphocyte-specific protein 1 isoform X3 [Mirounga angustirostris]|uniref:lymphocyte-specific protein 1 isoform X3 n=1 Tax=Mirounga angustirostris TaxID=9716 RepID=UPI0023E43A6B|nr:lymphocyte-specific protein 1 isoform X2 [Mirounga angustirostris]